MNILITGASGSVAHYLIDHIKRVEPGARITGISRTNSKPLRDWKWDLTHDETIAYLVQYVFAHCHFDIVFHLASMARIRPSFDDPLFYLKNNIACTTNLYEAIRLTKMNPICVLASTSEVYGDVLTNCPIFEREPFNPISPYGISKCAQEHLAQFYFKTYGIKTVVTRAFGYINPLRSDLVATAIAKQIAEAERSGGGTVRHGNTIPVRTFCDVRDVAEAYWLAATMCEPGEAYNIGSENPVSVGDLIQLLTDAARVPVNLEFVQDDALMRPSDVSRCVPDCSKFRRATGWKPKIPLRESLEWLMQYVREKDG